MTICGSVGAVGARRAALVELFSATDGVHRWGELAAAEDTAEDRGQRPEIHRPQLISAAHLRLLRASQTYLVLARSGQRLPRVLYRAARVHYTHNRYPRAVALFQRLVTRHPGHELAPYAAAQLLDSLTILGRHREVARRARRMLDQPRLARGDLRRQLLRLLFGRERWLADRQRRAGRHAAAARRFLRLASNFPGPAHRAHALYLAAECLDAAGSPGRSSAARGRLIREHPASHLVPAALLRMGQVYRAQGRPRQAALVLETFARRFPRQPQAPEQLLAAVTLWLEADQLSDARRALGLAEGLFKRRFRFARALTLGQLSLGAYLERCGSPAAAVQHYRALLWRRDLPGEGWRMVTLARLGRALLRLV